MVGAGDTGNKASCLLFRRFELSKGDRRGHQTFEFRRVSATTELCTGCHGAWKKALILHAEEIAKEDVGKEVVSELRRRENGQGREDTCVQRAEDDVIGNLLE